MNKINILMSTYNGGEYLTEQINSIMEQRDVDVFLSIRDDGSSDDTVSIIKEMQKKYKNKIYLFEGTNIGYRASFMRLIDWAVDADYYGFSDQDDVWDPYKCINGIAKLKKINDDISLYLSSLTITDENLNTLFFMDYSKAINSIESYFVRQRYAGCTYIFTPKLKNIVRRLCDLFNTSSNMPDHDFIVAACGYACGSVYIDNNPNLIKHRRLLTSVTSGGNGLVKRIQVEYNLVFNRYKIQSNMARFLLQKCKLWIKQDNLEFLYSVANYDKKRVNKIKLLRNKDFTSGMWLCDIETKFKIMVSKY